MNIENIIAQNGINFRKFFLKIESLPEFLLFQSSLFHSDLVEGKYELLK